MYYLGQLCGLIGTGITVLRPQMRKRTHMLLCTVFINAFNGMNFLLIGQGGASAILCFVAILQALAAIAHERRQTAFSRPENLLFFLLYLGLGIYGMLQTEGFVWALTWHNALELLPVVGALMLMLSVFARGEQQARVFLLLNGMSWLVYTAVVGAAVFFSSVISVVSSAIALWKYRKAII